MPEQKEVPEPTAPTTPLAPLPMSPGVIEVEFTVARVRIRGPVDASIVAAVVQALTDCGMLYEYRFEHVQVL